MSKTTIMIRCPKCAKHKEIRRLKSDPANAVRVDIQCPECNGGDFDSESYFDAKGREVSIKEPPHDR
jgi:hypothetical protein